MNNLPQCFGVLPARYGSTRFPGKPLADILGKPMFWHVYTRAKQCPVLKQVVLATDDKRIFTAAQDLNVPVVMTKDDHPSGTDRILEAAQILNIPDDAIVANIQGDEPVLEPAMLTNPDLVKVVFSKNGRALYFSRSKIQYPRDGEKGEHYGHIGLYAFRMDVLKKFVSLGASGLEKTEKLEQLRLLENGIPVHVGITCHKSIGVDRPEDIEQVIRILKKQNQAI
ncbi:MAG: 3-deoxy-manno-octulosonate cytidylyltransferase [Deltaproteobacteria bacterium]|nr:3-deoxy-manno-octulosonate cytidylyltransferase [Deltaproteobacteria bacterium]